MKEGVLISSTDILVYLEGGVRRFQIGHLPCSHVQFSGILGSRF